MVDESEAARNLLIQTEQNVPQGTRLTGQLREGLRAGGLTNWLGRALAGRGFVAYLRDITTTGEIGINRTRADGTKGNRIELAFPSFWGVATQVVRQSQAGAQRLRQQRGSALLIDSRRSLDAEIGQQSGRLNEVMSLGASKLRMFGLTIAALSLAFILAACSNLQAGQNQTIYVPTANGVEAQTVHSGPLPDASINGDRQASEGQSGDYRAIFSGSKILSYKGTRREVVFITGDRLLADLGSGTGSDFVSAEAICPLWGAHLAEVSNGERLLHCREYSFSVESMSGEGAPHGTYRTLSYEFDGLERVCDTFDNCVAPPLSHPAILTQPVCAAVIIRVFQTHDGREFRILESTDPRIYGKRLPIGVLSDETLSQQDLGADLTVFNTRTACKNFAKGSRK